MTASLPLEIKQQHSSFLDSSNFGKVIPYAVLTSILQYLLLICSASGLGGNTGQTQALLPSAVLPRHKAANTASIFFAVA